MSGPTMPERFWIGFIAALLPILLINFVLTFLSNFVYPHLRFLALSAAAATSVWATVLGSPVVAVGVGLALVADARWDWKGLRQYALLGMSLGMLPMAVLAAINVYWRRYRLPFPAHDPLPLVLFPIALGALLGACSAAAFWFAVIRSKARTGQRANS